MGYRTKVRFAPARANSYDERMAFGLYRYQHEGHLHFLTFSCDRRLPYLNTETAYLCFEHWLETLCVRHVFDVHGYVLMPNTSIFS